MKEIIFHIPHDGHKIPKGLKSSLLISNKELLEYDRKMSDRLVSELVNDLPYPVYSFDISRLMCDVERFLTGEIMEKYGMGYCYEKFYDNKNFKKINLTVKELTKKYYLKHHKTLNKLALSFKENQEWLLIDLHSFNVSATRKELIKTNKIMPDICIGFDKGYCSKKYIKLAKETFENYGYKVDFNYPYAGSLIPNVIYGGGEKSKINSIMIEINSSCYLDENRNLKLEHIHLKEAIKSYCLKVSSIK